MAGSVYLRRVQAINRNSQVNDVQRGMEVGQEVGKMLGGLSEAIKTSQKNALANKMMTDVDIANQPGAGQTQDLGTLPGGPQPAAQGGAPGGSTAPDPDPDPVQTNQPGASINPDFQPEYDFQDMPDTSVNAAANQQKVANTLQPPQPTSASGDFTLNPSDYAGGSGRGTVGGLVHTGGVDELNLMKEMQAMQLQKQNMQNAQTEAALKISDQQAKASGTGQYAMEYALKRAQLAAAQRKANPTVDLDKNPPPATNLDSEPVASKAQLDNTIGGKNSSDTLANNLMVPETVPDPTDSSKTIPNPDPSAVVISGNQVTFGPKNKRTTMPLAQAQIYAKQINSLRLKQGLPLIRVPGEPQDVGGSPDNPYPATNKLDATSRARGTWVRLPPSQKFPNGQVVQVGT